MPKAAEVISFPVNAGTTGFLREFSGDPQNRLNNVVERLSGIEAVLWGLSTSEVVPVEVQNMLFGIRNAIHDTMAIAELRPVGGVK